MKGACGGMSVEDITLHIFSLKIVGSYLPIPHPLHYYLDSTTSIHPNVVDEELIVQYLLLGPDTDADLTSFLLFPPHHQHQ